MKMMLEMLVMFVRTFYFEVRRVVKRCWQPATRMAVVWALLWGMLFPFVYPVQSWARGTTGEYADRVNSATTFVNPSAGSTLDQQGTVWNVVDDLQKRMIIAPANLYEQVSISIATGNAQGMLNGLRIDTNTARGWQLVDSTGSVRATRFKIIVTCPLSNANNLIVATATGSLQGTLTYPPTFFMEAVLTPGQSYTWYGSTWMHPVVLSTGSWGGPTESAQAKIYD